MKNLFFLCLCLLSINLNTQAQTLQLVSSPTGVNPTPADFSVCITGSRMFHLRYDHCPNTNGNCLNGCGANPVRIRIRLFRNNVLVTDISPMTSSDWINQPILVSNIANGAYRAVVTVQRRRRFICTWETVFTGTTNTINATTINASPNYNINGTNAINYPILACASDIKLNAAATSCETKYYIGVQEANQWWSRTYEYEWGRWFNGQAPNNINLQALAVITSNNPAYYSGTDLSRMGTTLVAGNLPSGHTRYYRVSVCTGEPNWQCRTTLIRLNGNCKISSPNDLAINQLSDHLISEQVLSDQSTISLEEAIEASIPKDTKTLNSLSQTTINIHPNPFETTTTIHVDNYTEDAPILFQLFNMLGEQVASIQSTQNQFNLERKQLSAGVYLYRATANDKLLGSGKVVIQ